MHRYVARMETNDLSVEDRVLGAFKNSGTLLCTGEKLDHSVTFELSVFDVGGTKSSLTDYILRFSGVTKGTPPEPYHAIVAEPRARDADIELFLGD